MTGGASLEDKPQAVFEHDLTLHNASEPIWQLLLTLAALLLILDIAVRRIVITGSDIAAARDAITRGLGIGRERERRTATSGRLTDLMDAKRRAATLTDTSATTESAASSTPSAPPPAAAPQPARRAHKSAEQAAAEADVPTSSLAARLLETRKKEQDDE